MVPGGWFRLRNTGLLSFSHGQPVIDEPDINHKAERDRLTTRGRRTDDNSWATLLVVHENDGSWTIHGLGAPGVRLAKDDMVVLAESILERVR